MMFEGVCRFPCIQDCCEAFKIVENIYRLEHLCSIDFSHLWIISHVYQHFSTKIHFSVYTARYSLMNDISTTVKKLNQNRKIMFKFGLRILFLNDTFFNRYEDLPKFFMITFFSRKSITCSEIIFTRL